MEVETPTIEEGGVVSCQHPPDDNANLVQDENDNNEVTSEDSGMSSVVGGEVSVGHAAGGLLIMPTSPVSVTTASMSASDDMIENENEMVRDRVADLEKRVHDQNDEITCLRATLADCLRRINSLETTKGHVQVNNYTSRLRGDPKTPECSTTLGARNFQSIEQ